MSARGSPSRKPEVVIAQIPANTSIRTLMRAAPPDRARATALSDRATGMAQGWNERKPGRLWPARCAATESVQCKLLTNSVKPHEI